MAQRAGRLTCPRCGANNFDTVTSCWKCGTALGPGAVATAPAPAPTAPSVYTAERAPMPTPTYAAGPVYVPAAPTGDAGVAKRAAILLALTFPWIGLPVGWVFMMIEDSRKQAIGRVCAVWSFLALILHLFFMVLFVKSTTNFMMTYVLPMLINSQKSRSGGLDSNGVGGSGM
jgi:hypothetical protein